MFKRLRRRLTLLCTLATGVILVAMACACLALSQRQLNRGAEAAFRRDVNGILYYFQSQADLTSAVVDLGWLAQTEGLGELILHVELSGAPLRYPGAMSRAERDALVAQAKDRALADHNLSLDQPPESRFGSNEVNFRLTAASGEEYRAAAATVPAGRGWVGLVILKSTGAERAELNTQRLLFALFTLAALILLALFSWFFTRRILRPIEESQRKQTEFIAAASHELRSPLAVIHAGLGALGGASPQEAERYIALADGECMRMSRLVGDLLALASADSGSWSIRREETELETLVLDVCEGFESAAREKQIRLVPSFPEDPLPRCLCDRERIRQVLTILVDNALSFTPTGGVVTVRADRGRGAFSLMVSDTGPGIPAADRERIFTRFYRADPSRTSREHYGLGLCIAQEIAALHWGTLTVQDSPSGGAVFILTLPGGG